MFILRWRLVLKACVEHYLSILASSIVKWQVLISQHIIQTKAFSHLPIQLEELARNSIIECILFKMLI